MTAVLDDPAGRLARRDGLVALARRCRTWLDRHAVLVPVLIGVVAGAGVLARILWPTVVGLGDQGDGHRLVCQLGLRNDIPWGADQSGHVHPTWVSHRYHGETCGANGTGQPYYSSHLGLLRVAALLTRPLGLPGDLDLRALAVVGALVVAVAVGWLFHELRGPLVGRLLVVALVAVLGADSGIAVYFVSPYAEPGALLGILLLCPAVLHLLHGERFTVTALAAVAGIAGFVLTTKTQMVSLLPVVVVLLLLRPTLARRRQAGSLPGRVVGAVLRRAPGLAMAAALTALTFVYLDSQPARFEELTQYNQVFTTILPMSPQPVDDLEWFGLDPELVTGSGSNVLSPNSVAASPAMRGFTERVNTRRVLAFYAAHPDRILPLVLEGLDGAAQFRLSSYLGNRLAQDEGPPGMRERRVEVFTALFAVLRVEPLLLAVLWAGGLMVLGLEARRGHGPATLGVALIAGAVLQFGVVMLTEGRAELIKHMFMVDVMSALCLPIAVATMIVPSSSPTPGHDGSDSGVK